MNLQTLTSAKQTGTAPHTSRDSRRDGKLSFHNDRPALGGATAESEPGNGLFVGRSPVNLPMQDTSTQLFQQQQQAPVTIEGSASLILSGGETFAHIQRCAKMFSSSDLVPKQFQGNIANCTIALEMAHRMGANPMAVMQNLYVVHGRPSWSASFIIACLNQCGRFSAMKFRMEGEGDKRACTAYATEKGTSELVEGPSITISMAKAEGWFGKSGSKWQTMPELMLRYRAATLFGRLYAPELLMGMQTDDEAHDQETVRAIQTVPAAEVPKAAPVAQPRKRPEPVNVQAEPATSDLEKIMAAIGASGLTEAAVMEAAIWGWGSGCPLDGGKPFAEQTPESLAVVAENLADILHNAKEGA